jgi:uncharacterized metal-binding protein
MEHRKTECAKCKIEERICKSPEGRGPAYCPTFHRRATVARANEEYAQPEILKFARAASIQERDCYTDRDVKPYVLHPTKPRVLEVCEFAHKMGYQKLGVAFCSGLQEEASSLVQILENQGFEVASRTKRRSALASSNPCAARSPRP